MKVVKKIFKVLMILAGIVICIILIFLGYILISNFFEERRLEQERIGSSNLMEYFKYHDFDHVKNTDNELQYIGENFVCDALEKHDVIAIDTNFLVLDDYSVYQILLDQEKTFSNNQSCKKIETDTKFVNLKKGYSKYLLIDDNNNQYTYDDNTSKIERCGYDSTNCISQDPIIEKDDVVAVVDYVDTDTYLVLKDDGQVWKQVYKTSFNGKTYYNLLNEEVVISKDDYGTIKEASTLESIDLSLNDETITSLVTDRGYFFLKQIETEECMKYEDIPCEYKFVESDVYKKYQDDVKFLGTRYTLLSDNTIIETKELQKPLDHDIK